MKSILDKSFKYRNSVNTDIRKTFARVRRQQKAFEKQQEEFKKQQEFRVVNVAKFGNKK